MASRFLAVLACSTLALSGLAPPASAQDAATGERLFRTRCASCHSLEPGQNRIGPSLNGVIGRQAGSVEGARYSAGLRDLGITWDAAQIDTFLANPRAMVKGSTMTISVTNAADRAAITAYLQSQPSSN
ncbi:c-type cytochrome [Ancylobacter radicis]|uniref:C-type cytochrome n=1 Tax=Ancylobacter radicis TaxID=2836179 RepID=A0ABS5R954_9HYPH|nr:c-type cytochrome [Ancylobacter radicis]MBS9478168.1 c-type cytochrome [Ancylobacter radicis]